MEARASGLSHDEIHAMAYAGKLPPADPTASPMLPDVWPAKLAEHRELGDGASPSAPL